MIEELERLAADAEGDELASLRARIAAHRAVAAYEKGDTARVCAALRDLLESDRYLILGAPKREETFDPSTVDLPRWWLLEKLQSATGLRRTAIQNLLRETEG